MKTLLRYLALQILPFCVYSQNTTLTPTITNQGYCYDSIQIREVARLSVQEKIKDTLIAIQDSSITNLKSQISKLDTISIQKDSIIENQKTIIKAQESKEKDAKTVCNSDKELLKIKHRKHSKKLFIVILAESLLIIGLIFIKK